MAVTPANIAAGSLSSGTATIPDDLAQKAIAAIEWSLRDLQNQSEVFSADENTDVTITTKTGAQYTGPSFQRLVKLANTSDMGLVGPIANAISQDRKAIEAASAAAGVSAAAAATSENNAKVSENNAYNSEKNAIQAETAAANSEKEAAASEAAAALSETNALDAAAAALSSQQNAFSSAGNASASATAADTSAQAAAASAAAALVSEGKAKTSENNAQDSMSHAATSEQNAKDSADLAKQYADASNDSRNDASGFRDSAQQAEANAKLYAANARAAVADAKAANQFTGAVNVDDVTNVVDFKETPTVKGTPIVSNLVQGGFHLNTDETCTAQDDLEDIKWQGKTFMVEKPIISGASTAPISSNNAPTQMSYDFAICTDFYSGWTPGGGAQGDQRVQMIFDQESIWIRGFHVENQTWTGWKRIATQLKTDVTGTDLDTLHLTGHYSYTSAIHAPVIDASEASPTYFLDVFATDFNGDIYQVMHSPNTNSRFDRYRIGGKWSRWWNSTATFDIDTAIAGIDLNTITNPGWWGVPLDTAKNLPTGAAFPPSKVGQGMLEVIGISNGATVQRLHYADDGDVYYRHRPANSGNTVSAWGAWKVEAKWDESRVIPVTNGGTGVNSLAALQTALGLANYAPLSSAITRHSLDAIDLNTLDGSRSGFYYQTMNANTQDATTKATIRNYPIAEAGSLLVMGNGANGLGCHQLYYPFTQEGRYYSRKYDAAAKTWSGWRVYTAQGVQQDNQLSIQLNGEVIRIRPLADNQASYIRGVRADNTTIDAAGSWYVGKPGATNAIWFNAYQQGGLHFDSSGAIAIGGKSACSSWRAQNVPATGSGATNNVSETSIAFGKDHNIYYNAAAGGSHQFNGGVNALSSITGSQLLTNSNVRFQNVGGASVNKTIFYHSTYGVNEVKDSTGKVTSQRLDGRFEIYAYNTAGDTRSNCLRFDVINVTTGQKRTTAANGTVTTTGSTNNPNSILYIDCQATATANFTVTGTCYLNGQTNTKNLGVTGTITSSGKLTVNGGGAGIAGGLTVTTGNINAAAGVVQARGTALTSDINKKKNLIKMENALDKLEGITGYLWDWKDAGSSAGVIAQDVEKVQSGLVETDPEDGSKTLNYSGVIGLLVNAIKELKAEVAELKASK